jgi:hypothetical protein
LNFIFGLVCLFVCVCAFSLRRESPDMILGDKPLISEVVLSHLVRGYLVLRGFSRADPCLLCHGVRFTCRHDFQLDGSTPTLR